MAEDVSTSLLPLADTSAYSEQAIKRKRALADALAQQGMDASPIRHPLQGAARLAQALVGGYLSNQADAKEEENNAYNADLMKGLLTPEASTTGSVTPAPAMLTPSNPAASAVGNPAPVAAKSDLLPAFAQAGSRWGVSPGYLTRTAQIESGMDPNAKNASGAAGLMQFVPKTAKAYNLFNPFDANASIDAAGHLAADNKKVLVASLGRNPTDAELYLAHQQGAGGAAKLLANPNAPAESIVGRQAVVQNGGKPGMTAGQFAGLWLNKFGGTPAGGGTQVADASGAVPAPAPAQNGHAQRLLAAMADPRLLPQNKQILQLMYANAVKQDSASHRHVVNGALVDDAGNVIYRGENSSNPEAVKNYEYYRRTLPPGQEPLPFNDWHTQWARSGATQITNNNGTDPLQNREYDKAMTGAVTKSHTALMDVEGAQRRLQDINAMQGAIDEIQRNGGTTGGFMPDKALQLQKAINAGAQALGFNEQFNPNEIASKEFLQKFQRQMAGAQAKGAMGARVTNFELQNFLKSNPGLEMSPQGNQRLLGIMAQIEQRNVVLGQQIQDYVANNIADGKTNNPAEIQRMIKKYDEENHITDPVTGQDLTKSYVLSDIPRPNNTNLGNAHKGIIKGMTPSSNSYQFESGH